MRTEHRRRQRFPRLRGSRPFPLPFVRYRLLDVHWCHDNTGITRMNGAMLPWQIDHSRSVKRWDRRRWRSWSTKRRWPPWFLARRHTSGLSEVRPWRAERGDTPANGAGETHPYQAVESRNSGIRGVGKRPENRAQALVPRTWLRSPGSVTGTGPRPELASPPDPTSGPWMNAHANHIDHRGNLGHLALA